MKCERVQLLAWHTHSDVTMDIPWPEVHRAVGTAAMTWLNSQDSTGVQLIMDQHAHSGVTLWAEFYHTLLYTQYCDQFLKNQSVLR